MAFGERRRQRQERKKAEAAEADRQRAIADASEDATALHAALEAAKLPFRVGEVDGVLLKKGEVAYLVADGAAFVEPRRERGHWEGGSRGTSVRIAKGVSFRVGASRATYVQGVERPTPTDTGRFIVTNQRCLFIGTKRTTEWAYSKLIGFDTEGAGTVFFNVTNRQRTTGVMFGSEFESEIDALIAAAIARFTGEENHKRLLTRLEAEYRWTYDVWKALSDGRLPPPRPDFEELPAAELGAEPGEAGASSDEAEVGTQLPPYEHVVETLRAAGFSEAQGGVGFGVSREDDRYRVFWLNAGEHEQEDQVSAMAKSLRAAGRKARVARQEWGGPYVSVTG